MFPLCSHPKAGSRLTCLHGVTVGARPNGSSKGRYGPMTEMFRWYRYLGRAAKMTVMGVLSIAFVVLMLTATGVI
jgi:hypothetical protein